MKLSYIDISNQITENSDHISLSGYIESGIVFIITNVYKTANGLIKAVINSRYVPRFVINGIYCSYITPLDKDKLICAIINTNGEITIWLNDELSNDTIITFMYPIQNFKNL